METRTRSAGLRVRGVTAAAAGIALGILFAVGVPGRCAAAIVLGMPYFLIALAGIAKSGTA